MGLSLFVRDLIFPYVEILRPIPGVAWIPLAILLWPTEEGSIIYITFLGALFPIVLNTVHGVEQTPEVLVRAAQSLGASRFQIFRHVILPGALPSICAGLAIGMGVSWFSLLAGEIISGQYGIGYFTWNVLNHQLPRHRRRDADDRLPGCIVDGSREGAHESIPRSAEEGPLMSALACLRREIAV